MFIHVRGTYEKKWKELDKMAKKQLYSEFFTDKVAFLKYFGASENFIKKALI